jgi:hypothetical protein
MSVPTNRPVNLLIPILVVALALPMAYVAGYFFRTASKASWPGNVQIRGYRSEWEARAFVPAAKVESLVTGQFTHTVGPDGEIR